MVEVYGSGSGGVDKGESQVGNGCSTDADGGSNNNDVSDGVGSGDNNGGDNNGKSKDYQRMKIDNDNNNYYNL